MKKIVLIISFLIIVLTSCKKEIIKENFNPGNNSSKVIMGIAPGTIMAVNNITLNIMNLDGNQYRIQGSADLVTGHIGWSTLTWYLFKDGVLFQNIGTTELSGFIEKDIPNLPYGNYFLMVGIGGVQNGPSNIFTGPIQPPPVPNSVPFFRYYNKGNGDHYYTTLETNIQGYKKEGILGYVFPNFEPGTIPIYRYYNSVSGDHYYPTSQSSIPGYTFEGIAGYVYDNQQPNSEPVYQYFNQGNGDHYLVSQYSSFSGYAYEGVAFYVLRQLPNPPVPIAVYEYYNGGLGDHFYTTQI
ncbi:hypothetical protein [Pedobacter paludis]|uniref:DUF5648 domain-containing protein n=1 Tax=Pedobacter paludis TaxID=2203212 RepID=A0A317F0W5_9SPHI|nr:hypothetical protein [Pedobacter paludis]PWS31098.1 hypothetical protein DF947_16030 [Pedobacter paludis]